MVPAPFNGISDIEVPDFSSENGVLT